MDCSNFVETEESGLKARQRKTGQPALTDITNDSPIVGLTCGRLKTPLICGRGKTTLMTPGSGEALLRGQVKSLLQMVEEETELHVNTPQVVNGVFAGRKEESLEAKRALTLTRSLMLDFLENDNSDISLFS